MVELYAAKVPLDAELSDFPDMLSIVSESRRQRIARFIRREDALRGLFGEWLIRTVASEKCALRPDEIEIAADGRGKPYFCNCGTIHFNLSHAGSWVLAAFALEPVGVDVEAVRPIDLDVASMVFSGQECSVLLSLPPDRQIDHFYRLWTLKESLIKALGTGFSCDLREFSFTFDGGHCEVRGPLKERYWFRQYDIEDGYSSAACSTEGTFAGEIEMRQP